MLDRVIRAYNEAVFDTDRKLALKIVHDAVAAGASPEEIVFQVVVPSLEALTATVSEQQVNSLAQHFLAAQIAAEVTKEMTARFRKRPEASGLVVIGASWGDFHGLGKQIVSGCLKALMFEVVDLGLNVSAERFVEETVARGAQIIAISSMMLHTARGENGCLKVRRLLADRGLEERVKVVVGGAPYRYDPTLYLHVRADAWAENGIAAGSVITGIVKELRK